MAATTMDRPSTYVAVPFGRAFVEQFRLLWLSRRPVLLLAGLLGFLALGGEPWSDSATTRLFTPWFVWLFFAGPVWAFAVWHNEGPGNRMYMWSQPVSRAAHTLARVAAGAAWLVILYALLIAAGALFAAFEGDLPQLGMIGVAAWVSFFTGPLIAYLIISVLAIPSDYPIRWFLGILFGLPILVVLLVEGFGLEPEMEWVFQPLINETWGLGIAMFGPFVLAMVRLDRFLSGRETGGGGMDEIFAQELWWLALTLWLLFWVGVVVLLARRQPDVLPRWRRPR